MSLKDYYAQYNIDLEAIPYTRRSHRFIRLNPKFHFDETLKLLEIEIRHSLNQSTETCSTHVAVASDDNRQVQPSNLESSRRLIRPVTWLDPMLHFYAIPSEFNLSKSTCFEHGRIYGQDASSGAAVLALLTSQYDIDRPDSTWKTTSDSESIADATAESLSTQATLRILDLCCCPGLKLCAIADYLSQKRTSSSKPTDIQVVGVDVSLPRLALCKKVVHKYQIRPETCVDSHSVSCGSEGARKDEEIDLNRNNAGGIHVQLVCQDGTIYGQTDLNSPKPTLVFDSNVAREQWLHLGTKRKRLNKSARIREQRLLRSVSQQSSALDGEDGAFDFVLVDAECSTDGSIKHVQQKLKKVYEGGREASYHDPHTLLTDRQKHAELVQLQRQLAASGFRLLRPGGHMVYSTCSLSSHQNEGVMEWLLREHPTAKLIPLNLSERQQRAECSWVISGTLPGTIRFLPEPAAGTTKAELAGEGFFLAKITKLESIQPVIR